MIRKRPNPLVVFVEIEELRAARERALRAGDATTATLLAVALRSAIARHRSSRNAARRMFRPA